MIILKETTNKENRLRKSVNRVIQTVSCGGIVIYKGKILVLYKNFKNKNQHKYIGWVFPKGTLEIGESFEEAALREVKEESGVDAEIVAYIDTSEYTFQGREERVCKTVHWYLMKSNSFYSKPQKEEHFIDSGYYKFHEAYHLMKFSDERYILNKAYQMYLEARKEGKW